MDKYKNSTLHFNERNEDLTMKGIITGPNMEPEEIRNPVGQHNIEFFVWLEDKCKELGITYINDAWGNYTVEEYFSKRDMNRFRQKVKNDHSK